jgi:hypothetical protein
MNKIEPRGASRGAFSFGGTDHGEACRIAKRPGLG